MARPTAIENVTLFDGRGDACVRPATVVIADGRISKVGPASTTSVPPGSTVIDAAGKTALPGLIDMHVHLKPGVFSLFLAHGVTSVKDVGNQLDRVTAWREAEQAGEFPSPRIHLCGPLLEGEPPVWPEISRVVVDPATARATVDELAHAQVDALKLYMRVTLDVMRPIIGRAHELGIPVTAHLGRVAASDAVAVGLDGIEHVVQGLYNDIVAPELRLDADDRMRLGQSRFWAEFLKGWAEVEVDSGTVRRVIDLLLQNDVFIVCTLVAHGFKLGPRFLADHVDLTHVPDALTSGWVDLAAWFTETWSPHDFEVAAEALEKAKSFVAAFHDAGGRVLAGTDAPFPYIVPGASLHQELELLVNSGLTPAEALRSATLHAADALGRGDDLGTLQPGKFADLVIVDGDPVADIRAIKRIDTVFKDGHAFKRSDLVASAPRELEEGHPVARADAAAGWSHSPAPRIHELRQSRSSARLQALRTLSAVKRRD
ncbi:MAG: amidohydrolase family protein [Actinomycetota bacterium]|nr:amidohydrolase family protein [Actinomycetota bacterium]